MFKQHLTPAEQNLCVLIFLLLSFFLSKFVRYTVNVCKPAPVTAVIFDQMDEPAGIVVTVP